MIGVTASALVADFCEVVAADRVAVEIQRPVRPQFIEPCPEWRRIGIRDEPSLRPAVIPADALELNALHGNGSEPHNGALDRRDDLRSGLFDRHQKAYYTDAFGARE